MNLFFHDQALTEESLKMVQASFGIFHFVINDDPVDISNTKDRTLFFEKAYSVVGNDGIWFERFFAGPKWPSSISTRAAFDDAENFAWRDESIEEFMLRTLRQAGYVVED
jgi:hypothetical protein